jgi:F-type H+-transporting ATPase subunit delta
MAEYFTVARPYAEALFAAARADQTLGLEDWLELIDRLARIAVHPAVERAMTEPRISSAQRAGIFISLVGKDLPAIVLNFISLLFDNNRLAILPQIAEQFATLKHSADGAAVAQIMSAFELTDAQLHELVGALELKFGLKLKPRLTIDRSLIGGVRVAVGDQVLDMSVQAQLARMRDRLAA